MSEDVVVARRDSCLEVGLGRIGRKNALTNTMYDALRAALETAESDDAIRSVLIHGGDGVFSAGNDVAEFAAVPPVGPEAPVFRFLRALSGCPKIIIAAVDGLAIGIGTTLLLHCDFVYASTAATFQLPFINLAIVPEAASSMILPSLIGRQKTMDLLLTGRRFNVQEAEEFGFISRIVEAGDLLGEARALADSFASRPPQALLAIKRLVTAPAERVGDRMTRENEALSAQIISSEGREAIGAFLEKRQPRFE